MRITLHYAFFKKHLSRSSWRSYILVNYIIKMDENIWTPQKSYLALIATKLPTFSFINVLGDKILSFNDILHVNYNKNYFEIRESKIEKTTSAFLQTSYINVEGNFFELYPDGNPSDYGSKILQESLSNNKMGTFLQLDYHRNID